MFLVFSAKPFPTPEDGTMPMDLPDWSPYAEWPDGIVWRSRRREDSHHAQWVQAARDAEAPAELISQLEATQFVARIDFELINPKDLGYLQFSWAVVRWLLGSGATVVVDGAAQKWFSGDEILAWHKAGWPDGRRFSLEREISTNTYPVHGEPWWMLLTQGLAKFARPDLLVLVPSQGEADLHAETRTARLPGWGQEVLIRFATEAALGRAIEHGTELQFGSMHFVAQACEPGVNAPTDAPEHFLVLVNQEAGAAWTAKQPA